MTVKLKQKINSGITYLSNRSIRSKVLACFGFFFVAFIPFFIFSFVKDVKNSQEQYVITARDLLDQTSLHLEYRTKEMLTISNSVYMMLNQLVIPDNATDLEILDAYYHIDHDLRRVISLYPDYKVKIYTSENILLSAEGYTFFPPSSLPPEYTAAKKSFTNGSPKWRFSETDRSIIILRTFVNSELRDSFSVLEVKMNTESFASLFPSTFPYVSFSIADSSGSPIYTQNTKSTSHNNDIILNKNLQNSNWNLSTRISYGLITENGFNQLSLNIIFLVVLIFICIFITKFLFSTIVNRIVSVSNRMIQTDFSQNFQTQTPTVFLNDEIGIIEKTFEKTCRKVNTLINEVYLAEQKEKAFEFEALQKQINPHFLYNCLDTINWMAFDAGIPKISDFTSSLGKFYRLCLHKGKSVISIEDEIEICWQYVKIQQIRYEDKLSVFFEIDPRINSLSCVKLSIQPLIENAIKHSLCQSETLSEQSAIIVDGYLVDSTICIDIFNNHPIVPCGAKTEKTLFDKDNSGFGLKNTKERLSLFFSEEKCQVSIDINEWTIVSVRFPAQKLENDL